MDGFIVECEVGDPFAMDWVAIRLGSEVVMKKSGQATPIAGIRAGIACFTGTASTHA
ncbi:hypothetical protein [Xanthomonas melonis]|uniref:hypothetical protein n=1 Tax=Xanthomonas melonis TaxID=56456 RepID=UPI00142DE5E9|nr:hypothetical protein [Xanthomonas melonis]MCC4600720.1 hypothetical protein [Xanthomonas melonis]